MERDFANFFAALCVDTYGKASSRALRQIKLERGFAALDAGA